MQGAEVLTKFTADTSQVDRATKNLTGSFGGLTKAIALGNIASEAFNKTLSMITSNMDSAISRTDTLNNFPKVMSNLGIESKEAEKSIALMSDKLIGLPTMLDEGAMAVQRFTSANGDVKKSTDIFLAVNNAILAGGANAQLQSNALEQLSQAYAKGKPDMMEWRSMMSAMPAQLKQVAIAMGYVNSADLGEALRGKGGEAEFQRFIETIVQLNTTGIEGFANFEEQARGATGGISTSVKNMKNAFVRGVADIITKTNEALKPFGGITGVLGKIGKFGEKAFSAIGTGIQMAIPYIIKIINWLKEHETLVKTITVGVVTFITTFTTINKVIEIINMVKTAFMALNTVLLSNPIGLIVVAIAGLVTAFVILWNKCEGFRNFWIKLWNELKPPVMALVNSLKDFWNNVLLPIGQMIWGKWAPRFNYAFEVIKGVAIGVFEAIKIRIQAFLGVIRGLINFVTGVFTGDWKKAWGGIKTAVSSAFNGIIGSVKAIGGNIIKGLWNGMSGLKDWVINKVKGMGKSILDGLKKVLGIHSPSTEFALVGRFSGEGFVEGLEGMQKQIDKTVNATFNPFSNGSIGSMTASTPTPNVTIHNSMQYDALGQLVNNVKTFSGGAKNDYNYVGGY